MAHVPSEAISIPFPTSPTSRRKRVGASQAIFLIPAPLPPDSLPIQVLLVTPIASNLLRVYLSDEPRHQNALGPNDALNRLLWAISLVSGPLGTTTPVIEQIENPQPQPNFVP